MLVASKVIPRRITDVRIVPKIPVRCAVRFSQHLFSVAQQEEDVKSVIPRYPIAMPNNTHKNAGVIVIRAVMRRKIVSAPMIMPAITAPPVQLISQPQFVLLIYFTSTFIL